MMAAIAQLAGVSASTVSRALAASLRAATPRRDRSVRLAREQGDVVSATARALRLLRTETLALAIPLGPEAGQQVNRTFRLIAGQDTPSVTLPAERLVSESTVGAASAPASAAAAGRR